MPNHGLARISSWEIVDHKLDSNNAFMTLRFASSDNTKEYYPFDFEVLFTYILESNQLIIEQSYRNLSDKAVPIYAGLHPYFKSVSKSIHLDTDATEYFDYNDCKVKQFMDKI
jgi:galactose mutarotase-like enzyme